LFCWKTTAKHVVTANDYMVMDVVSLFGMVIKYAFRVPLKMGIFIMKPLYKAMICLVPNNIVKKTVFS